MIVVIKYGMGNIRSVEKALIKLGADFVISNNKKDFEKGTHFILPGVGHFKKGMRNLEQLGLIDVLKKEVNENNKFLLGVCLGMQLLFNYSEEGQNEKGENVPGLGFIDGEIIKFNFKGLGKLKIPHVGWNDIYGDDWDKIELLDGLQQHSNFYFVHSFYAVLNSDCTHLKTDYGHEFVSVVKNKTVYGTQFHPEKSQKKGLSILKKYIELEYKPK